MRYSPEVIEHLQQKHPETQAGLELAQAKSIGFAHERLVNDEAKHFMLYGVGRRLQLIRRSAGRIFEALPPDQVAPLGRDALQDVNISLHAFIIHSNALQDNLAWTFVKEFGLALRKFDVSLFKTALQRRLPQPIQAFLIGEDLQAWHKTYSTDFRDGLAHRIPLYVPPAQLTEQDTVRNLELQKTFQEKLRLHDWAAAIAAQDEINSLGTACPYFLHDFNGQKMVLHPQILCDSLTVIELFDTVVDNWGAPEGQEAPDPRV